METVHHQDALAGLGLRFYAKLKNLPAKQQNAFSLIELILVMAILVLVGALAAPAIHQTFARQSLDKGADRVRVAMGQARVRSIRTGEIHAVFFMEGGSWFNVAPFVQFNQQAGISRDRQALADQERQTNFEDDLLPVGITFAVGYVPIDARAAQNYAGNEQEGQLRSVLFYPDGTSQNAKVGVKNDRENFVEIQLRGLTGLSTLVRADGEPDQQ